VSLRRTRGSALVIALALLVVLAGIGVGVTRLVVVEAQRSSASVQQIRLAEAARLGLGVAGHRARRGTCSALSIASTDPSLAGIQIAATCVLRSAPEGAGTVDHFLTASRATTGRYGSLGYGSVALEHEFSVTR
jgi:Tfp pilus assembly protein PilX